VSSGAPEQAIDLRGVSKRYRVGKLEIPVLRGLSLQITAGELVAIVGSSGNGKSTLLNLITGIDRPTSGQVVIHGEPIHDMQENQLARWRRRQIGIVFQFFQLLPALTLLQNVILPMDFAGKLPRPQRRKRARELLELVGLSEQAERLPNAVSGGQQQRAAIARSLANDPPIVVADEPTGNLDPQTSHEVFSIFVDLVARGKTVVLVTHDGELACRAPRRIEIRDGRITRDGSCRERAALKPPNS
jgi:putative ABC transport system ATP-binding protein